MSVTTTANPVTQSVLHALADYELTHSGDNESTDGEVKPPNYRSQEAETTENPDWWPTEYNGIPPHRPIDYNLDDGSRPRGSSGPETVFVVIMLNIGVGLVGAVARSWRLTGGRVNDKIFRYSIGGER